MLGHRTTLAYSRAMACCACDGWDFSSPEPEAHKVSLYSIPKVRRPSSSTLSNLNISEASRPFLIKFCVASLGWGKRCIRF